MKIAVVLLSLWGVVRPEASVFFHEPSLTKLMPSGDGSPHSHFGFSMAYQDSSNSTPARLVVGAPRQDFVGTVYSCPLSTPDKDVGCSMIDMKSLDLVEQSKTSRQNINKDQYFFFGSSIVATSDYFLTCAPLLTKHLKYKQGRINLIPKISMDAVGACYVYNSKSGKYTEWIDNIVKLVTYSTRRYTNKNRPTFIFNRQAIIKTGGVGWNTLLDTDTENLLVAKTANIGDLLYVDIENPLDPSRSIIEDYYNKYDKEIKYYNNFGYGLTVGKFFSTTEKTYATSVLLANLKGRILFVRNDKSTGRLSILDNLSTSFFTPYYIETMSLGSMFGYALGAADINLDGFSELLVGTPAQSFDKNRKELGALHIYIGGENMLFDVDGIRMRTIIGNKENGRFGAAVATNDIDGDFIPEIFVSAPYENEGTGVVYVISGYELRQTLGDKFKRIKLSELPRTQKLQGLDSHSKTFGFSLQIVKDVDNNGCNELAVGSPESSSVLVLRCLPTVNATTTLKLLGDKIVKETATSFTVSVCLSVNITSNCHSIVGSISVKSFVTGNTQIKTPQFVYELTAVKKKDQCENVIVDLLTIESGDYTFRTEISTLDMDINGDRKEKGYKSWVVLSPYSNFSNSIPVKRHCTDEECKPKLAYEMTWLGGPFVDTSTSQEETVLITVNNTGGDAAAAFVRLTVHGTKISRLPKKCFIAKQTNEYTCSLPKPMKQGSSHEIAVMFNTAEPINTPSLDITAQLYDTVFTNVTYEPKTITVPYELNPSLVLVNGSSHNLAVTDKDIDNVDIVIVNDAHEYYIFNNGTVLWMDILAELEINKESFIEGVKVLPESCLQIDKSLPDLKFSCRLTINPGEAIKIIANIAISMEKIKNDITIGDLSTSSKLSVNFLPTNITQIAISSTQLKYQQILTVGNDKNLVIIIAVVVTVILLVILVFVLYKFGFFKRAEKKKLDVLRESVRKRSIKLASESSRSQKHSTNVPETECDIEVVDEVFQEIDISQTPQSSKDDVILIKEKAI